MIRALAALALALALTLAPAAEAGWTVPSDGDRPGATLPLRGLVNTRQMGGIYGADPNGINALTWGLFKSAAFYDATSTEVIDEWGHLFQQNVNTGATGGIVYDPDTVHRHRGDQEIYLIGAFKIASIAVDARIWAGTGTYANLHAGSDDYGNHYFAFQHSTPRLDTNWMLAREATGAQVLVDTGVPFAVGTWYIVEIESGVGGLSYRGRLWAGFETEAAFDSGWITTDIPGPTIGWQPEISIGGVGGTVVIQHHSWYMETNHGTVTL